MTAEQLAGGYQSLVMSEVWSALHHAGDSLFAHHWGHSLSILVSHEKQLERISKIIDLLESSFERSHDDNEKVYTTKYAFSLRLVSNGAYFADGTTFPIAMHALHFCKLCTLKSM